MEAWRSSRPKIADSHHFDEEQDLDPNQIEKSVPNPHQSENSDPDPHLHHSEDPHHIDADPQHRLTDFFTHIWEKPTKVSG
jgi:hypothetical protein